MLRDMKDEIINRVVEKFQQRSEVGIKKYGTTLKDNNTDDFLVHLQLELMDAVNYIEKLLYDVELLKASKSLISSNSRGEKLSRITSIYEKPTK